LAFLRGEYPNRWPGFTYVWTHGWEDNAHRSWDGPYYVAEDRTRSYNAYYRDPGTVGWMPWTVRIVPASATEPE